MVDDTWISDLRKQMPELPMEKELRYNNQFNLPVNDAAVLTDTNDISEYFERVVTLSDNPKSSANWVMGPVKSVMNEHNIEIGSFPISSEKLAGIIKLVDQGKVSQNIASKQLFPSALSYPKDSLESILEKILDVDTEEEDLEAIIRDIVDGFPKEASMFQNGQKKLLGMFMGQIMKATKGKADPKKAQGILLNTLNIE
jgi:aspartyl-tRNA(Asn)/glutamyl-tRNA(Gln) amidotransferase subunit B